MADPLHTSNLFSVAGYWVAITGGGVYPLLIHSHATPANV